MANSLYSIFARDQFRGLNTVDFDNDTIKAQLHRTSAYTVNQTVHDFEDDLPAHVAEATISNLTVTLDGEDIKFDCDDFTFASVPAGAACDCIVFYKDTGTPSTSPLIIYYDNGGSLTVTPNGNDITVTVNANGLLTLNLPTI